MAKTDPKEIKVLFEALSKNTDGVVKEMQRLYAIENSLTKRLTEIDNQLAGMSVLFNQTECRQEAAQGLKMMKRRILDEATTICEYLNDWKLKQDYEKKKDQ